mgnify:CR=1 FL=1
MRRRSPSVAGIKRSVDTVAVYLPDLTINFVPHCAGSTWLVDPDTCTVYVDGTATCDTAADALIDALTALGEALSAVVVTARQLLGLILRLIERQHVLGVGIFEVVGQGEGFGPVRAVAVAGLQHPTAVGSVAAVH